MKKLVFILLFIISCTSVFSQSIDKDSIGQISSSSKINYRKYKWDIGTDLVGILNSKNNSEGRNAYSFFVRKNVNHAIRNTFQTRKVGYRLRIGISTSIDNQNSSYQSTSSGSNTSKRIDSYMYIRPGYEWQKQWERIQFIYGVDIHVGYSLTRYFYADVQKEKNQKLDMGLFGFVGIKYFISPRAAISTESAWYTYYSYSTKQFEAHTSYDVIVRKESRQTIGSYFIGFYTLNFSFYFN